MSAETVLAADQISALIDRLRALPERAALAGSFKADCLDAADMLQALADRTIRPPEPSLPAEAGGSEAVAALGLIAEIKAKVVSAYQDPRLAKSNLNTAAHQLGALAQEVGSLVPASTLAAEREKTAAAKAKLASVQVLDEAAVGKKAREYFISLQTELDEGHGSYDGQIEFLCRELAQWQHNAWTGLDREDAERAAHEETRRALDGIRAVAKTATAHRGNIGKEVEFLSAILHRAEAALRGEVRKHPDHVAAEARIRSLEERLATAADAIRRNYEGWRNAIELGLLPDQYVGEVRGLAELCWNTLASLHNPPQQPGVTHGDASQGDDRD